MENGGIYSKNPEELYSTIVEGMTERKRPSGRPRNILIGQIKKDTGVESYRMEKKNC